MVLADLLEPGVGEPTGKRARNDASASNELFAPRMPVAIPIFEPNPLDTDAMPRPTAYIDVAFDVTKQGRGDHIEILDTTANATRRARREFVRLIERTSFRPRSTDGRFAEASRVVVRYYLSGE